MALLRDITSAAHHHRPLSPGRSLRDSIEEWIEELEFDVSLSAKLWANFLLTAWPVSGMGKAVPVSESADSTEGTGSSFDLLFPLQRAPQSTSVGIWRQVDRWVNEGGAIGRPDTDIRDQQLASSKEIINGRIGD
jgi:hypothetical protein